MKKLLSMALALALCLGLAACGHTHTWKDADCTAPKTCTECGKTEGELGPHVWVEATCEQAKHCELCGETEGQPLTHNWTEATYDAPRTCSLCGKTEGEPLPKPYYLEKNLTLESQLPREFDLPFAVEFTEDGEATEIDGMWFGEKMAHYTVEELSSAPSAQEGCVDVTIALRAELPVTVYCDTSVFSESFRWDCYSVGFGVGDCNTGLVVPDRTAFDDDTVESKKDFEWDGSTYSITKKRDMTSDIADSAWVQESGTVYKWTPNTVFRSVYTITVPTDYDGTVLYIERNGATELNLDHDETIEDKDEYLLDDDDGGELDADHYIFYRLSDLIQ